MTDRIRCCIAVIGAGPRALGALESLVTRMGRACRIDIFDPHPWPGAGPNFSPDQSRLCQLNLPLRLVDLGQSPDSGPDLAQWLGEGAQSDRFPARAELGGYLVARMMRLSVRASIEIKPLGIRRLMRQDGAWLLDDGDMVHGPYHEILLAQGQPDTVPDPQIAAWRDHAAAHGLDMLHAYPDHRLLRHAQNWAGKPVGIRGLGLSTLDAVKLLTLGMGGRIENGRYRRSGREPSQILPFSLDGRAPAPKPADAEQDARFDPHEAETEAFRAAIAQAMCEEPDTALRTVCTAIEAPALRILRATGGDADPAALSDWLSLEREKPGSQDDRDAVSALRTAIDEAHGRVPPSQGYVVGQLLRKWQNALRQGFNPTAAEAATAAAIVGFDEGLKRFSYGPPVEGATLLLTLIEDGIVDPRAAEDPKVQLTKTGWRLIEDDDSADVSAMVDAVLPSPDLSRVADDLMRDLIESGRVVAVDEGLGARIAPDGVVIDGDGTAQPGLCLLGRMAAGSVIAVDSIHDCFGAAADRWAEGVATRAAERAD